MSLFKGWSFKSILLTVLAATAVALAARLVIEHSNQRPGTAGATAVSRPSASTDRLIQGLQTRLSSGGEDALSYSLLGSAYLQKARETGDPSYYTMAEGAFRRALALSPQDPQAMTGTGLLALSRHQFQEALDWGEQARQLNPQDAYVYGVLGDAYVGLGRYEEAWDAFQKMIDRRPDLSSYSRVSYARELNGDIPGAIQAMKRALDAGGPNAENTNWTGVQLGHLYFSSGDMSSAEAEYHKALARFPGYIHAQAGLARAMAARGQYAEAIAMYQQVVERIPLPEYVIALGDVHKVASHPREAAKLYALVRLQQQLYQANGVNTDLEMALFDADHDQDLDTALAQARQEYQKRPSIWAADVLAWTLYKTGEYPEASRYSQEALRLGTKDALLLFHAGMINYKLSKWQQARGFLERAFSVNPYFSVLYKEQARGTLEELRAEAVGK